LQTTRGKRQFNIAVQEIGLPNLLSSIMDFDVMSISGSLLTLPGMSFFCMQKADISKVTV
jgi:hypothetical protein